MKELKEIYNYQKDERKLYVEELLNNDEDVCIVIPRPTFYFCMWKSKLTNNKNMLDILEKYRYFQKQYDSVINNGKDTLRNYIIPLTDAKCIIESIKNIMTPQKFQIKEITELQFEQMEKELNDLFIEKERIQHLKQHKYLTMEEKKELALAGKNVPICVSKKATHENVCGIVKYHSIYDNKNKVLKL